MYGNQFMQGYCNYGGTPMTNNFIQPAQQGLIKVTGIEGAKAYQMSPNSAVALFDANEDVFYVKSTDGAGFPTIKSFQFSPIDNVEKPSADYVTRVEFNQLKEMLQNGEFTVSKE